MIRRQKKWKINIWEYAVSITISYPVKQKAFRFDLSPALYVLLFSLFGFGIYYCFNNSAYPTRTSSFLEEISPVLGKDNKKVISTNTTLPNKKIIFHGPRNRKFVALTFDADMTAEMKHDLENGTVQSYYDRELIKILNETKTRATLFMSGMWIESYAKTAKALSLNPLFELGNHTYSHLTFEGACYGLELAKESKKISELEKTQKLLKEITGVDNKLFRFPGGCYSESDLKLVSSTGQVAIHWDVAAQDGFNTDATNIVSNVVDNVQNGSVIVMHMNGYPNEPKTSTALPVIISALKEKGFEFVTVSELFKKPVSELAILPY